MPKPISPTPPISPMTALIEGWLAAARRPKARASTKGNSTSMCPIAHEKPERAPPLLPCIRVAKNNGPGASAPDAVTTTTVATKSTRFIQFRSLMPRAVDPLALLQLGILGSRKLCFKPLDSFLKSTILLFQLGNIILQSAPFNILLQLLTNLVDRMPSRPTYSGLNIALDN